MSSLFQPVVVMYNVIISFSNLYITSLLKERNNHALIKLINPPIDIQHEDTFAPFSYPPNQQFQYAILPG